VHRRSGVKLVASDLRRVLTPLGVSDTSENLRQEARRGPVSLTKRQWSRQAPSRVFPRLVDSSILSLPLPKTYH
jgi:hypothetical protein